MLSSAPFLFSSRFSENFKCFPVQHLQRKPLNIECGGKIILPQSALVTITQQNIPSPMLFKITNRKNNLFTHVGVLEFTAEKGVCYVPNWLYQFLDMQTGDILTVEHVTLPVATFAKFQPLSEEFLDITNQKAVLENELRRFACLTTGDIITIHYNDRVYKLRVLQTLPAAAVNIIVCDMHVEFEAPDGYMDSKYRGKKDDDDGVSSVASFQGHGIRLDGKERKFHSIDKSTTLKKATRPRGIPDYSYGFGELHFDRNVLSIAECVFPVTANVVPELITAGGYFPGAGFSIQEEEID